MSSHADFVHLRVHSAYSLSEGALKLKELVGLCQEHRMPAVAVTDTANLFGALEFAGAATGAGLQPIIGCQINLRREQKADPRHFNVSGAGHANPPPDQLVLLVQDKAGYLNLMKLVSKAFLETPTGELPQISFADLAAANEGLLCFTGGPAGPVGRLLLESQRDAAVDVLKRLIGLFPGRLYVELMRHGMNAERRIEAALLDLAYDYELPLVATNDCYFANEAMYEAHDALLCIAEGTYVVEEKRRRLTREHRFKSAAEMRALFADLPEAIDNTIQIARRCAYYPDKVKPILPAFTTGEGRDEAAELRVQAAEGLEDRLRRHVLTDVTDDAEREALAKPYRDRLDFELNVINQMGFPGYFLIVADFIRWAKNEGIPVGPGRGSGAGSVVAWALTITDLDPLRWNLLFERFLNPERVSMPDFDIDFCQERRDEVIRYVQKRYGTDKVAQIITFGKLQARAVLRDVGRVLQLPYGQVDRICKLVPNNPANPVTLAQAIEGEPELQRQRDDDPTVGRMINMGLKLEGLYRHASTHAAGVVIGDRPLDQLVPLYRDPRSDMPVTQFNMKYVETAGLVKFDFLGLKTLSVLAMAERLIRQRGVEIDLTTIPLEDEKTFKMLSRGDATGVFQLESSGMRDVLRKLQPDRFEDIIAVVALYRPGPMDNIPSYINRKHGTEKPDYLYPTLEPILTETYGIMIYQEQVMQIAQVLSGYSLGGADLLRRAMGKKIKEEMDAQRKLFVDGAVGRGVSAGKASDIFDQVAKFAGYGFNKSHAAAYALVAYQTAYLKANYPVEFLAASMTFDLGNTDKLNVFRQELQRLKIDLLPPDINKSEVVFSVERASPEDKGAIRYALAAVKNVGAQAMGLLIEERRAKGPFKNLGEFAQRADPRSLNKRQLENLVAAGAFDGMERNRAKLYEGLETLMRHASAAAQQRVSNEPMFLGVEVTASKIPLRDRQDWPIMEKLQYEFDALGFYLSAHPLDAYGKSLERIEVVESANILPLLSASGGSKRVKLAGILVSKQERTSKSGNRFAFVTLTDRTGVFEITLFSEILAQTRELIDSGQPLLVSADARAEGESYRLLANSVEPLDKAVANAVTGLKIFLRDDAPLAHLKTLFDGQGQGRGKVRLVMDIEEQEVELALPGGYQINAGMRSAIKSIPGIVEVRDI
ncbi:DNA polymerase III subunit alpha [Oceanibaculum pacificum]|uniref:DNA polymerase III subunit alpha n=1 Tax=Oceanibaculum pacificum TaxID=580166 RepID=A0A154W0Z3_9PROT|nr:DNA polymerase III subunit alpha [Oceanibaculum pacificum]KZD07180.1 DNA polymerase III subunit alpha [Oceanibaculum pacificum]